MEPPSIKILKRRAKVGHPVGEVMNARAATGEEAWAKPGEILVVAKPLVEQTLTQTRITEHRVIAGLKGADLAGTVCAHPLRGAQGAKGGYDFDVPLIEADFVGFVIPDKFVVGYGIDYAQAYRDLPYIGAVDLGK